MEFQLDNKLSEDITSGFKNCEGGEFLLFVDIV